MQDLFHADQLAEKIESSLRPFLEKYRKKICSVILGSADDFKTIQIWLDKKWEDFGHYDQYNKAVTSFEDRSFVDIVQNLDENKSYECLQDAIQFKSFGNTLLFTHESLNRYYQSLENRWRLMLVAATTRVCERRALGEFPKPLAFKVLNISNGNHPDMVGIYGTGSKPMPITIGINEQELELWVHAESDAFNFVLTDPENHADFSAMFDTEGSAYRLPFTQITACGLFGECGEYSECCLYLAVADNHWKIDTTSTGSDSVLLPEAKVPEYLAGLLRATAPEKYTPLISMPSPDNTAALAKWLHDLQLLHFDFGWKDLEIAIDRFGIQAAYAVLPIFKPEHELYQAMHKTAVDLFLNAGKFESALASLEKLDVDRREDMFEEEWAIFVGLQQFEQARTLLKKHHAQDLQDWKRDRLTCMGSLITALEGDEERALMLLQPLQDDPCPWILARALAKNDSPQACATLIRAFAHYRKPMPLDEHFRAFPPLHTLLERRNNIQRQAVVNSAHIAQQRVMVKPDAHRLDMLAAVRAKLSSDTPEIWQRSRQVNFPEGAPVRIISSKGNLHVLGYNAQWATLDPRNKLKLGKVTELGEQVDCAAEYDGLLYFVNKRHGIEVIDVASGVKAANYPRYFYDTACSIAVNATHIAVCSNLGVEIYRHERGKHAEFDTLLGAGEKSIPYAWAKDAVFDGNDLYVAAGNAGLIVYRIAETPRPTLVSVLSLAVAKPFVDRVVKIENRLYLEVQGALWIVDVADSAHPQSLAFYLGSEKSYFALPPMLTEDSLLFADREEPVLWAFDKKTGLPAEKICALSDGQGGSVSLYYLKDTYLLSEQAFLAVAKHGIFRIEKIPCPELSSGPLDQIRTLENALYTKVMDAVQAYASASIDCDIGALMLEFSNKKLELCLIAPRDLAGIQGYSNTTLAKESLDPVELGLDWVLPDTWPHDRLVEKDLKNAQRALLESVMERVATTDMECYYKQNLYLIIEMYNESIDRNSTFVYKILRK